MFVKKADIRKIHSDSVIKLGSYQNIFLVSTLGLWKMPTADLLASKLTQFCHAHPKAGYFCVVSKNARVPDSKVRKSIADAMAGVDIITAAIVIEAAMGFWGAAALGFMAAVQSIAKQPYPSKSFSDLDEATKWFARTTKEEAGWNYLPTDITSIVKEFLA